MDLGRADMQLGLMVLIVTEIQEMEVLTAVTLLRLFLSHRIMGE